MQIGLLVVMVVILFGISFIHFPTNAKPESVNNSTKPTIEQMALTARSEMLLQEILSPNPVMDINQTYPTKARALKELLYIQSHFSQ